MNYKLLFLFFVSICNGQISKDKGLVYYNVIESFLSGAKNGPNVYSTLVFDKNKSSFVTTKDSLNSVSKLESKNLYLNPDGPGHVYYGSPVMGFKNGFEVYSDFKKDTVWSSFKWRNYIYVKEKRVKIDWILINETKKIGNFECKKATGILRGREYTAWYTDEIPLPYGPWKLQGLPGLILEAYNENQEIYFCALRVEYPTQNETPISKVKIENNGKWLTFKESLDACTENLQWAYEKCILLGGGCLKVTLEQRFKEFKE